MKQRHRQMSDLLPELLQLACLHVWEGMGLELTATSETLRRTGVYWRVNLNVLQVLSQV